MQFIAPGVFAGLLSLRKRMSREKSEPGRVAPVIPGRHGPALKRRCDIHYLKLNKYFHPALNKFLYLIFSRSDGNRFGRECVRELLGGVRNLTGDRHYFCGVVQGVFIGRIFGSKHDCGG